jgi:hypothetical protein
MKPEYDAKLKIEVSVTETKNSYTFTMHYARKATTWKERALGAGFQRVMEIVDKYNEDLKV